RQTEALQRAILENAGSAVITTDLEGLVTLFNRAAEELLGYESREVVGRATPLLFHDEAEIEARLSSDERARGAPIDFATLLAETRRNTGANAREWTYLRKDGSRVPVLLTVTVLRDDAGGATGYLGMAVDLTSQRAHQEELLELNRLLADRTS